MKKLLALLLALMMTVCVFTACGDDADTSTEKDDEKQEEKADKEDEKEPAEDEASEEDAVKATMNEFAELYFAGDEKALEYVDKDAEGYEKIEEGIEEIKGMEEEFASMAEGFGLPEEYNERVEEISNNLADGVFGKMSLTVNDVEVDGDKAVAKCTFETPDFDQMEGLMSEELVNEAMTTAFTQEEIEAINTADEATQTEATLKLIETMFDLIVDDLEITSKDVKFDLEKVDGKWIIIEEN